MSPHSNTTLSVQRILPQKSTLNTAYTVGSSAQWVHTFVYHIFIHFRNFSSILAIFIHFPFIVHPPYLHYIVYAVFSVPVQHPTRPPPCPPKTHPILTRSEEPRNPVGPPNWRGNWAPRPCHSRYRPRDPVPGPSAALEAAEAGVAHFINCPPAARFAGESLSTSQLRARDQFLR
jgi:hypothetical protein